jgi:hypothetical protein
MSVRLAKKNFSNVMVLSSFILGLGLLSSCGRRLNENQSNSKKVNSLSSHPNTTNLRKIREYMSRLTMTAGLRPGDFVVHQGTDYSGTGAQTSVNNNNQLNNQFNNQFNNFNGGLNGFMKMFKVHSISKEVLTVQDVLNTDLSSNFYNGGIEPSFQFSSQYRKTSIDFYVESLGDNQNPAYLNHTVKTVQIRLNSGNTGVRTVRGSLIEYQSQAPTLGFSQGSFKAFVVSAQVPKACNPLIIIRDGQMTGQLVQCGTFQNFEIEGLTSGQNANLNNNLNTNLNP